MTYLRLSRKTRRDILFVVTPISFYYPYLGQKRRGMQLTRKFSIICYSLADILKVKTDPFLIAYMGTLIFLGDEISDKSRGKLMDGLLEHVPKTHPILKVYGKFAKRATSQQLKNIMASLAQIQDITAQRQFKKLSCSELEEATRMKGGYTLQVILHMLKENPSENEKNMFMQLGFLIQLIDDSYDTAIDKDEGISTLCTEGCYNIKDIDNLMHTTKKQWLDVFGNTNEVHRLFLYLRLYKTMGEAIQKYPLLRGVIS